MSKEEILSNHEHDVHYYGSGRSQVLKAMGIHAKQQVLDFIHWAAIEGWVQYDGWDSWINQQQGNKVMELKNLYELFESKQ